MKNSNFLKLFLGTMFLAVMATFVSCVDDNDDTEAPYLKLSPTSLQFTTNGTPAEGSQSFFEVSTNRHWTATVKDDKSWVTLSATEGDGSTTVQVSIPENINDEASVVITISNKVGPLMSETLTIRSGNVAPSTTIYHETVGTAPVSDPYPYVDVYQGWNKTGTGSSTVTYSGTKASVRSSGLSNVGAYEGASGPNVVFFGTLPANFTINQITLTPEQTNLKLTFGASSSYKPEGATDYDNTFDPSKFTVSLSADGTDWVPLSYTINNGDEKTPYWVFATSNFTLKQSVSSLYIMFTALTPSAFRLDDITLSTGSGGQEIDLGGGSDEAQPITIPQLIAMMTTTQTPVDANADRYFEAIVQNDVAGGNYSFNNLILTTENATTAGNGITLYGSQVEPTTLGVTKGDKIKVTLYKGLAQVVNFNGMYEVTGDKNANWAKVEKLGTATVTPVTITADKLSDYQGMPVTIQSATPDAAGIWANSSAISPHAFAAAGTTFTVFCKKDATVFVNQPYQKVTGSITGLAAVNQNAGQLVPRNLDDVKNFSSSTPTIVSVTPASVNFPSSGGTETLEVSIVNQGSNTLSVNGYSGIVSATANGAQVTVNAQANTSSAVNQTLIISLSGGNSIEVPVSVAAAGGGGTTYSLISSIGNLTAGKYLMAGFVETTSNNENLKPYSYQLWTGEVSSDDATVSSNSDLVTVSYQYTTDEQLMPKSSTELATTEVELVAVAGKADTYYIKVGNKYLYNSANATNRRLYFKDTTDGAEWVFINKTNGTGISASNNATYLITASATFNYIRSYKTETQTKTGIFFFKKN